MTFGERMARCRLPELMDDPALDPQRHRQALRGLERINAWSRSVRILWSPIQAFASHTTRPLRVLDLATGAGDLPIAIWQRARRAGLSLELDGCDRSPTAVAYARARAKRAGARVGFFVLDALTTTIPGGYDVLVSSLFLHHLDAEEAVELLRHMAQAAGRLVLVNDLVRSRVGYGLAYLGTRLLSRSEVVHTDGLLSVRAAWTIDEVLDLAARAGLHGVSVVRRWPCRFLLLYTSGGVPQSTVYSSRRYSRGTPPA